MRDRGCSGIKGSRIERGVGGCWCESDRIRNVRCSEVSFLYDSVV